MAGLLGLLMVLMLGWAIQDASPARAAPDERGRGTGSSAQPRREQTTRDLKAVWNFDADKPGEAPTGFSPGMIGDGPPGLWQIEADPVAPSVPNRLVQTVPCPGAGCLHVLLAEGTPYEYPDLAVRLRMASDGAQGGGGIAFGARDARNFYAAIVDLGTDTLEVVRVVDGQVTVLGREPIKRGKTSWHLLRVQHNTILSKDFVELSFDGHLALSISDKALGGGRIGLVSRGEAAFGFDNFHAIQLFSQRPLSPPAAY